MKYLVLGHAQDRSALAVAARLKCRHSPGTVRFATVDELIYAPSWVHQIEASTGNARTRITLHDGCELRSDELQVVFNRLSWVDYPGFAAADRSYACAEMSALLLSWLESLDCPVINPVAGHRLNASFSEFRWLTLAAQAGLPIPRTRLSSNPRRYPPRRMMPPGSRTVSEFDLAGQFTHPVLILGGEAGNGVPSHLKKGCRELARLSGAAVLKLSFASRGPVDESWQFLGAHAMPQFLDAEVDAVAQFLETAAERVVRLPAAEVA